jgi:ureidoacrylate peracid hydrolase
MAEVDIRAMLRANLKAAKTALIVVDVQNDFCAKGGYFDKTGADLGAIDPAVDQMADLIAAARASGVMVIFVRSFYDPIYLSPAQNERRRRMGWDIPLCRQGTWGVEFYRLSPKPEELVVTKHRYDAFFNTDLELVLRSNDIRNVTLCGVATNVCVESTARSAFFRDFEVVLASDCCAARNTLAHEAALENVRRHFGMVAIGAEIQDVWRSAISSPKVSAA